MSNIRSIPLLDGSNTKFRISNNAAWVDSIYFAAPGFGPPFVIDGCSITAGLNVVSVPIAVTTAGISPQMQIFGAGVGTGFVRAITSPTTFTMGDQNGNALLASATSAEVSITFNPPPLDLSGIGFISNLRSSPSIAQAFLVAQTGDGTMVNGAAIGTVAWNVPVIKMRRVPAGTYVMDLLAADETTVVNLFPGAPATVIVAAGVSDIGLLTGISHP